VLQPRHAHDPVSPSFTEASSAAKNVLAIMIQSFVSMGWTTVIWFLYGYSCASAATGTASSAIPLRAPAQHHPQHSSPVNPGIPLFVHVAYQMMFAIITPALITGAFANRVTSRHTCCS